MQAASFASACGDIRLMKHAQLIRHGEGAANAGEASLDHATIPLTSKGVEQAQLVAKSLIRAPAQIVTSPFFRAQVTALAKARPSLAPC